MSTPRALRWPPQRIAAVVLAATLAALSFLPPALLAGELDVNGPDYRYNIYGWEFRNFASKWLYEFGDLFRSDRSIEEQNAAIQRFLDLTVRIEALETASSDTEQRGLPTDEALEAELSSLRRERDDLENFVEDVIESRISAAIEEHDLTRDVGVGDLVWPPVDFEFTDPPRSLATSPRSKIELLGTELVRSDLTLSEIEAVEAGVEDGEDVSALAFPTGGIGAYPTIVGYPTTYRGLLELVAHEWTHNYLFFHPLGFNYYRNSDTRTMNETTADLAGKELADVVIARWPLAEATIAPDVASPPAEPEPSAFDPIAVLRQTRVEVEELLGRGQVDEAEALMETRRQELAAQGYRLRKLNQAYFAFTNLYAGEDGNPTATNPIGPKIDELRGRSDSLRSFMSIMQDLTSVAALDAALSELSPPEGRR